MGSSGLNIPLVSPAAVNVPPSWSFVLTAERVVLAQVPADSMIGSKICRSAAGGTSALRTVGAVERGADVRAYWSL
jgi:hypothetical protein